jgi:Ser/Thr protein kinase RdoA (MazF antagonist)
LKGKKTSGVNMREPAADEQEALQSESGVALARWGLQPGDWRLRGVLPGVAGGLLRPVIETSSGQWVVRQQAPDLTLDDTRFRHSFMAHLASSGVPVPALLPTPAGQTWAIARERVYELQAYRPGEPFAADDSARRIESAAARLGALHQASSSFAWAPYTWPEERSAPALAQSYINLMHQAAEQHWTGTPIATRLTRAAEACEERAAAAAHALSLTPSLPELHIHGDFQPHHLAFSAAKVIAIYDFDAARWEQRVYELAYALLMFTGLRWTEDESLTTPRVDDGLDVLLARRLLSAYGGEAPPSEDEAPLLADALALVFPIALANGIVEDLVFAGEYEGSADEEDALARLDWADRFWLWLDRYRESLAEAWENG